MYSPSKQRYGAQAILNGHAHTPGPTNAPEVWIGADGTQMGGRGRPIPNGRWADEDSERPNALLSGQTGEDEGESRYRASSDGATSLAPRLPTRGVFARLWGDSHSIQSEIWSKSGLVRRHMEREVAFR